MEKTFISAGELLADSFRLAARIYRSGYRPDFVIGIWRGGAPVAAPIHEYLQVRGIRADHIAIKASSYTGIDQRSRTVEVAGLEPLLERVRGEHALLLVDDVFDTGLTLQAIVTRLCAAADPHTPAQIRIACPWYKPARNRTPLRPDFYLHETERWLVFPHELAGLTPAEIRQKPDLKQVFSELDL
ncbi:MAG: hypoxanthine phosphoribosyltransferase [Gammaproteobacteria bacterium]|nr:hypoxanthine phosphoribosyltransferase [Gammaproteobacteria bacterium]